MIVDLSVPVVSGMPVYPGDPEVEIAPALTVAVEGVNVLGLHLGSQSGTHVDAPFHIDDTLPTLDDLPLERFLGPAAVLDARGLPPRSPVSPSMLEPVAALLRPGTVLLVATGWDEHWGTPEYLAHPYLDAEAARLIVAAGVRTVGVDALSVDPTPAPADLLAHRVLCGAHAVIAENLRNLGPLLEVQAAGRPIEASLLPLRLHAADGSPVRAVARIG
ncbi:Kynurenine formamidase [Microbispora rosea]|uniref:Kynurenine formamidase n=1 Tax=Microbispora rosea TaxID=58117 RepID=A0A1N7AK45_9ACTN|nr:cyclase family protein [Microbispora rosea]GIH51902.1 cyclase [Microbispora rosea subsp. rosea]SIR39401.1 Kynurenine formamidase [Microbispora rosea]